jgi:proline iminopeptidase
MVKRKEGYLKIHGGRVWYEIVGEGELPPLVLIHGGPGGTHDYLKPFEDLTDERKVIFYDQLGSGKSAGYGGKSLWNLASFADELQRLIKSLGLDDYYILGHSWGAAVAISFAVKRPQGLKGVLLSDPLVSTPLWEKDAERLIPKSARKAIRDYERDGKNKNEYLKASKDFYKKHVWGMARRPWPALRSKKGKNWEIYNYLWGPQEFTATGTLKKLDLTKELREIRLPVLLLCGRYDEVMPSTLRKYQRLLPDARVEVFGNSAHWPFWTDRKAYMASVRRFLKSNNSL